jgi:hypothetical protein
MFFGLVLGLSGYFHTREDGKAITDDIPFRKERTTIRR